MRHRTQADPRSSAPSFGEALRFWWKLGWISFGGPAGQIAIMHKELIERRRWMSEEHFLHALNFCTLLPGPEAQQLATYLGWRLHGIRGGIAAGALFVIPSVFLLLALSWLYLAGDDLLWVNGLFYGLTAAVIAIVVSAVKRIGSKVLKSPSLFGLAGLAFGAIFFFKINFALMILAAAGMGAMGGKFFPKQFPSGINHGKSDVVGSACCDLRPVPKATWRRAIIIFSTCLVIWWLPVLAIGLWLGWESLPFQQGLFFSKTALITIGGAYAVLPYVAQMTVEKLGWLTQTQMMAGLGLAETTPGPLIMVLQFVGFVAAWQNPGDLSPLSAGLLGALVTTWVTFLPCFLFVFLGAPYVERLRERPSLSSALTGITAAVVGGILNLAIGFAWHTLVRADGSFDVVVAVLAIGAWVAIENFKMGLIPTLGACALMGVLFKVLGWA